jgi:hypothetical protein
MNARRIVVLLGLVAGPIGMLGCGSTTCGGHDPRGSATAPKITAYWVLPPESQIPGDPWTILFGVDFEDQNGDLAAGSAESYLNDSTTAATQTLDQVFRQSGLVADATSGSMWITLRFAENTVDNGARIKLGLQLIDAADQRSNCFTLDLEFAVKTAADTGLGRLLRWASREACTARGHGAS